MSYKKIEDISYLYENIDQSIPKEVEDCVSLIVEELRSRGYSDNAIECFIENSDEVEISNLLNEKVAVTGEVLKKGGPKIIQALKTFFKNRKLGNVFNKSKEVIKNNPLKTAAAVTGTSVIGSAALDDKDEKEKGNTVNTNNTNNNTNNKSDNNKVIQPKPSTQKDEIITKSTGDVGSDGKPVTPGNRGASIDVTREGTPKPKPKPEIKLKDPGVFTPKVAPKVETPKVETPKVDPKPVKMSNLERQNRARFGDTEVDRLKQQQIDFKKMQANSQLPGADRGAEKAKFIKKYPKSITAQKAAGLRDHYDPEEVAIDENRMASHTAGMSDAQKDAATSSVSRSTADKMGRRSDESAFKGRKKKTSARYSSTGGKKRKNTTGRGQPEQYRKSADSPENEGRYPYGRSKIVQGKGSFKGLTKEDFAAIMREQIGGMTKSSTNPNPNLKGDEDALVFVKRGSKVDKADLKNKMTNHAKDNSYHSKSDNKGYKPTLMVNSYDAFDIVLGYLQESGQVDSIDEALYIMMEMDAATIQGIVRDFEILSEEAADKEKDDRLVKYGIGHDGSDKKAGSSRRSGKKPKGKTPLQKETEKKYGKGVSPLDVVKKKIEDEHGKGAIKS